ncbi:hypothetical protein GGQ02_003358 [Salinibacter ruber]|nr:hypothetical protein [Salinibacter ruber]
MTLDEMVDAIQNALADDGELPCTLVALDEIQQYIGDDSQKTFDIQEVVEKCSSEFGGRLMFVGTGQTALTGTPELEKLTGRFNIQVQLSDADVQAVTRKTVLKKKASKRPDVRDTLTENSGEISRHLSGTEFEEKPEDEEHLIDDYPILPTRRRFWERVLRAVDEAGTKSQLRTQLKLVDEAVKQTAEESLGTVVPGDFIYDDLRSELLQSGVLAGDIDTRIESLRSEEDDELGARLCALAFLIGKLPREEGADTGLRATPEVFADLLVTDLEAGSGTLRNRVEERLEELEGHVLMKVEGEYRMQTQESQEWMSEFRERHRGITKKRDKLATHRSDALREAANDALDDVRKINHGKSNERRDITVHFSKNAPAPSGESIPVWVRDQWRDTLSSVEADAREAGHDSPMVYVFLPKRSADQLDEAIATERAAKATIGVKRTTTQEGEEARQAMITRREQATKRKESALEEILDGARVYLAGGKEYVGDDVAGAVENAALSALERLYPKFETADDSRWGKVLRDATGGSADALKKVDFQDNPEDHPVCEAVLEAVSTSTSGQEVRKEFTSAPHGWPQDAVDAALALLTLTNHVRAKHDGEVVDATDLTQRTIGKARFRAETVTLSKRQELEVLNVLKTMTDVKSGQELEKVPEFLERVRSLADRISGAAPLPEPPNMDPVDEVARLSGNERLAKLHDHKEWFHGKTGEWQSMANRKDRRETEWSQLQTALRQGQALDGMEDVREEAGAVRRQRSLLQETNPVESPLDRATELLREELQAVHKEYESAYKEQLQNLRDSDPWQEIGEETRASILRRHDLGGVPEIEVGTTEALLDTLSSTPLDSWRTLVDALSQRFDKALSDAIRELEPDTTRADLESRVLKSEEDVEEWLEEARETLLGHLENGPVQV